MRNIFLLYMPPSNHEAMVHYEDTIVRKVAPDVINRYVNQNLRNRLSHVFGGRRISVWGSRNSSANRGKYERMQAGDEVLIIFGDTIRLLGKIACKTINPDLSRHLWKNLKGGSREGWDLIYFIANPQEINVPFAEVAHLFGYAANYQLRGFSAVSTARLEQFYERYDDLYNILMRIKRGEAYSQVEEPLPLASEEPDDFVPVEEEDVETVLGSEEVSDHVKMQWKLIGLGIKAGSKVWIPVSDQSKIRRLYESVNFEEDFTSGLDTPAKFVENIDVVWKDEYRIDAAFEIENSTSIYSGLLRFADLNIVAPNTLYPMFIVAPTSKKNRLREQLKRPSFKKLKIDKKVRYLSYENIDDIDHFFANANAGLTVDLIYDRSELVSS